MADLAGLKDSENCANSSLTTCTKASGQIKSFSSLTTDTEYRKFKNHFYNLTERVSYSVPDVNGGFIVGNSVKVDRWREHFEQLLNFYEQLITPALSSAAEFRPSPAYAVSCDPPPRESCRVKQRLHDKNKHGEDGIFAEIYKDCVDTGGLVS
ncbi:unnamed protein product [Schistocephalus solidus]|uniref:Myotubularin phosphatase domain-containing protein n=1 Tax=Schistocephalus solidus TaxID=70667 RepID=A0A183S761_SCHSO|nr:unnamed protein product [Schistocephalus solidus]